MDRTSVFETSESPRGLEPRDRSERRRLAEQPDAMGIKPSAASFQRARPRMCRNAAPASPGRPSGIVEDAVWDAEAREGAAESLR